MYSINEYTSIGNDRVNEYTSNDMDVWSGNGNHCYHARRNYGARGIISVTSNFIPG